VLEVLPGGRYAINTHPTSIIGVMLISATTPRLRPATVIPMRPSTVGWFPPTPSNGTHQPRRFCRSASRAAAGRLHLHLHSLCRFPDGRSGLAGTTRRPFRSKERMPDPTAPWVAVAEYGAVLEADFAAATLTEAGIPARVTGAHVGLFGAGYQGYSMYGARVLVPWHREEDARRILADLGGDEAEDDGEPDDEEAP
jgi:hypothetical protein